MTDQASPPPAADPDRRPRQSPEVRGGPLIMGIIFGFIGILALALNPDGFDERAMALWPVAVLLLFVGAVAAAITHIVQRRSTA